MATATMKSSMMNKTEVRGKVRKVKGRVKEAVGVVTGNRHLENKGAAQRTEGAIETAWGKTLRMFSDAFTWVGEVFTGFGNAVAGLFK